jgi:hypothetical protein
MAEKSRSSCDREERLFGEIALAVVCVFTNN